MTEQEKFAPEWKVGGRSRNRKINEIFTRLVVSAQKFKRNVFDSCDPAPCRFSFTSSWRGGVGFPQGWGWISSKHRRAGREINRGSRDVTRFSDILDEPLAHAARYKFEGSFSRFPATSTPPHFPWNVHGAPSGRPVIRVACNFRGCFSERIHFTRPFGRYIETNRVSKFYYLLHYRYLCLLVLCSHAYISCVPKSILNKNCTVVWWYLA